VLLLVGSGISIDFPNIPLLTVPPQPVNDDILNLISVVSRPRQRTANKVKL